MGAGLNKAIRIIAVVGEWARAKQQVAQQLSSTLQFVVVKVIHRAFHCRAIFCAYAEVILKVFPHAAQCMPRVNAMSL